MTHQVVTSREAVQRLHVINIFPFKAYAATGSRAMFLVLPAIWLTGLGVLAVLIFLWRRDSMKRYTPLTDKRAV